NPAPTANMNIEHWEPYMQQPYPLENTWRRLREELAQAPVPEPTGITRDTYLDIAERIIRAAVPWQDSTGTVIDPYRGEETNSCTARFVGSLGLLISAGLCTDLVDACVNGYEACLLRLDEVRTSPEFWTKELMYAHQALKGKIPDAQIERWETTWKNHDARACYNCTVNNRIVNSVVFALAGEFFKTKHDLASNPALVDELLATQRPLFTAHGLYRDPNDPMTYDMVVRQQLDLIRSYGYSGTNLDWLTETSRRGALTTLLYQSSIGQAPFGGRSNQFHFVEAHIACMCESQARFYKAAGDLLMAGIFKRAGHRAIALTLPWIMDMEPYRHTKQGFDPSLEHGVDSGGYYSIYGILMASLCGTAYHLADESIQERLTPAEHGGYAFDLYPAFHKVFATCPPYHVEIDTQADLKKDATGLGRFHRINVWPETALSGSIAAAAEYTYGVDKPVQNLAIGPAWTDTAGTEHRLAGLSEQIESVSLNPLSETPQKVAFEITYRGNLGGCTQITETYVLTSDGLTYTVHLGPEPATSCILLPILTTDGQEEAQVNLHPHGLDLTYRNAIYRIRPEKNPAAQFRDDPPAANRNAFYRTFEIQSNQVHLELLGTTMDGGPMA
ncbi:MAG: hypothetical protein O2954_20745, partial [bacterium]|nr:hypothetical protein [bacterium]